jgi:hypothetical protein
MVDNVAVTPGSGATFATDDVGGIHHQRVKMSVGADGVAKDLQPATVVAVASDTADVQAVNAACTLLGWSFGESAGTAAVAELILRDGTDATGTIVAVISLNPDETIRECAPNPGIKIATGVYVDRVGGTTQGSIWYVP